MSLSLGQDLRPPLGDRFAKKVGLPKGVAGQATGYFHYLFLIEDHAIGAAQRFGQRRMEVGHRFLPMPPADQAVHHAAPERARPVEGDDDDQIIEVLRPVAPEQLPHAAALELEGPDRPAFGQRRHGQRVIQGDALRGQADPVLAQKGQCVLDDRQVAQTEQVDLEEPQVLHGPHIGLRHDLTLARFLECQVPRQRLGRHHHPRRMLRDMAR